MLETAISVVQNTDAIPELGLLGIREVIKRLLVGRVGLLEVVHHKIAVAEGSPDLAVVLRDVEHPLKETDRLDG